MKTILLKRLFLCIYLMSMGITCIHAQQIHEINPKHKAYVKNRFGIDLSQMAMEADKTLSPILKPIQARTFSTSSEIYDSIPVFGINKASFVLYHVFDPCGSLTRGEECTCRYNGPRVEYGPERYIRFHIAEPMDVLITNILPGTRVGYSDIKLWNMDTGEAVYPTKDCHEYHDYDKIDKMTGDSYNGFFGNLLQSFYVHNLLPGYYYVVLKGVKTGNMGTGNGRIETLVLGSASSNDNNPQKASSIDSLKIPLEKGFQFSDPINIGSYREVFAYDGEPLKMINYIGFYNENKPFYNYDMYPEEDPAARQLRYEEYLRNYKDEKNNSRNVVYKFSIETNTLMVNLSLASSSKIYLLDKNKNEIVSGNGVISQKLTPGEYYAIIASQEDIDNIRIDGEMYEPEDPNSPGGNDGGGSDNGGDGKDDLIAVGKGVTTTYSYNIRSWTKSIEAKSNDSPLFNQTLYYNEQAGTNKPQYGGNISAMEWCLPEENKQRGYNFEYDDLSRLTSAGYLVNGSASNNYSTAYSYDKHGNMLTTSRYGKTTAGETYGLVDNLTMTYNGNQLINVKDTGVTDKMSESADFMDYAEGNGVYTYNKNGAMNKDTHKGITGIEYNSLNLPVSIEIDNGSVKGRTKYLYSASGVKLQVTHETDMNPQTATVMGSAPFSTETTDTKVTDYVGNKIYEDGVLKKILVDGGYIDMETGEYHFYITDHLGNNRVVAKADGTVVQKNHYYPFGMEFAENLGDSDQPYKYNGKELDKMHGLNMYDYSARYMEPATGRFTTVDPLAEKYYSISPYAYCNNNPIRFIDPDGLAPGDPLLNRYQRNEYGGGALRNIGVALHNTVAAVFNIPVDIVNSIAFESQYIYNNGIGAYLGDVGNTWSTAVGNQVDYWQNTPMSQQLSDEWKSSTTPQALENTAAAGLMMGAGTVLNTTSKVGTIGNAATKSAAATESTISPNVQNVLKSLKELKSEGGTVNLNKLKSTQEVNMTIGKGAEKINLRIETHVIDKKNGGNGTSSQRHMNIDYYKNGKRKTNDHTILE